MSDGVPDLRHHSAVDVFKVIGAIVGVIGVCLTVGAVLIAAGKNQAAIERIGRIEDKQTQQDTRLIRAEYESAGANSTSQRVEQKVDDGFKDINAQLRQLNITGHHRQ